AYQMAYMIPNGITPFKLIFDKSCQFLVEIGHKAYWAVMQCNPTLAQANRDKVS
ncbi:hypothetical protein Csa_022892, partial [Cucumis sativus]